MSGVFPLHIKDLQDWKHALVMTGYGDDVSDIRGIADLEQAFRLLWEVHRFAMTDGESGLSPKLLSTWLNRRGLTDEYYEAADSNLPYVLNQHYKVPHREFYKEAYDRIENDERKS